MGPGGSPGLQNRVCPDKSGRVGSTPTYSRFFTLEWNCLVEKSILLLEDDLAARGLMLKVIQSALAGVDPKVYITEDGNEALKIINKYGESIDLFSTDVIHPGAESCDLMEAMKVKNSHVKTILITGSVTIEEKCNELADYILTKPFTNEAYSDILKSVF